MYCTNCGKKIPSGARFCPECGGSAQSAPLKELKDKKPEKKIRRRPLLAGCIVLVIGISLISMFSFLNDTAGGSKEKFVGGIFIFGLISLAVILLITLLVHIKKVFPFLKKIILYLIHHPKLSIPLVVILIIAIFFLNYKLSRQNYQKAIEALPLIQDSLTEVTAAKIMGNSIIAGRPIAGASWKKVRTDTEAIVKRLSNIPTPSKLRNYQKAIIVWADAIAAATKDTKTWKNLANQPGDFQLKLNNSQTKEMFLASAVKIRELKEFGDNAFKKKDRGTMRYIAARLLVQKHWIDGILHSQKTVLPSFKLAFKLTETALADNPYCDSVRQIYREAYGVCQGNRDCISILNQGQADLESFCGMNWEIPIQQTPPEQTPPEQTPPEETPQNQPPANNNPPTNQNPPTPEPEPEPAVEPYDYEYPPEEPKRDVCIPGKTASYCAEPVAEATNEVAASTIGFAEGQPITQDAWDRAWADVEKILPSEDTVGPEVSWPSAEGGQYLGGVGITTGEPAFGGEAATPAQHSPRVQAFYDVCKARGSFVGGSNKNKGRLPTTEDGYHCSYKQGANNCWDFLTYSGGRYLGGDVGCREWGLIP